MIKYDKYDLENVEDKDKKKISFRENNDYVR